ncbi:MAG: Ig-like domain-containing protein [bacterium]|nr:Ig-like domain-containing protein [bacterium]
MFVESCNLGCTSGAGGAQVACAIVNAFQNTDVAVRFSQPVDLASVSSNTFRVIDVSNGTSPTGTYFLDPNDRRRVIFRPSLSFDDAGNPIFGLEPNRAYVILIPGQNQQDPGPFITSTQGNPNLSRLDCTIVTSEGIQDLVPGDPGVERFVDVVTAYDPSGNPTTILEDQLVTITPELTDVWRGTAIDFVFGDVMNVASVVNPATGQSPFLRVEIDVDGDPATLNDRLAVAGTWSVSVDIEALETLAVFTPLVPLPPAGTNPAQVRRLVMTVPESVIDLAGNPVLAANGGGPRTAVTETVVSGTVDIIETFLNRANEDLARSGARWGTGRVQPAIGGGSGRLGDLHVRAGETVVLNTDSQDFPLPGRTSDLLGNPDAGGQFPTAITISDGAFEFASLIVEAGAVLRVEGDNPARLYSRGSILIADGGLVDLSGTTPEAHESTVAMPEMTVPRLPSPAGGGDGGYGADRFDHSPNPQMLALTNTDPESDAIANPGADTMGRPGQGVGRTASRGEGEGGVQYPTDMPFAPFTSNAAFPHGASSDIVFDPIFAEFRCRSLMVGGVGSGGAYATDGGMGVPMSDMPMTEFPGPTAPNDLNFPAATPGGDAGQLNLAPPSSTNEGYVRRVLNWQEGYLRGGAGGGGGGNHQYFTRASGYTPPSTLFPCIGPQSIYRSWHDHSGAMGGSGGGALHMVSGKRMQVDGVIDASGGNGGSATNSMVADDFDRFAMPGGGGSGGAIKLQALVVALADNPGRLDVSGGMGGTTVFSGSLGGEGGTGLVRIEDFSKGPESVMATALAPSILPYEMANNSVGWVSAQPMGFPKSRDRPDSFMGSSSCWIRPEGSFFQIEFAGDTGTLPADQGWNMTVLWQPDPSVPPQLIPFRGTNSLFPVPFEDQFGKLLGHDLAPGESAAPIVVRFQGARSIGSLNDGCGIDLDDPQIIPGSVTPWVDHPEQLNGLSPAVDMIRFVVVFDGTFDPAASDTPGATLYSSIAGVTNLRVSADLQ